MLRWSIIAFLLFTCNAYGQVDIMVERFSRSNETQRNELTDPLKNALEKIPLREADKLVADAIDKVNPLSAASLDLHRMRAHIHYFSGKNAEAIAYSRRALEIATKMNNQFMIGKCNLDIGFYYRYLEFYTFSAEYLAIAADFFSKLNNPRNTGQSFYETALTNYKAGNYQESILYQRKSLREYYKLNPDSLTHVDEFHVMSGYNTLGLAHNQMQNYDSALFYLRLADSVAHHAYNAYWIVLLSVYKGEVLLRQGKVREALPLVKTAYANLQGQEDSVHIFETGLNVAECYIALNNIDSAFMQLKRLNEADGTLKERERYWRVVAQAHEKTTNGSDAVQALRKALQLRDSAARNEEAANLARLKTIYELQHKEDSIRNLSLEVKDKQTRLNRQSSVTIVTASFFVLAMAFAFIFYKLNRKNRSQLKTITFQKTEIDEQNRKLEAQSELLLKLNLAMQEKNISIEKQKEEITSQNQKLQDAIEELKNTQSQLVHIEKMAALGQVTAGIAHEINNPLNFISGGVDALSNPIKELAQLSRQQNGEIKDFNRIDELENDAQNLIATIKNGVQRSNKIITNLQAFSSRQESGFSRFKLHDILDSALTILNSKIKQDQIDITLDGDMNLSIFGDGSQLTQVLINLIDNAIQALQEKETHRKLRIGVAAFADQVQIAISDNGKGIPEVLHHKIFEPFFTTKPIGKGTGLGLSISYSIIEKHKGKLSFTSKPGWGTEFKIVLPA